MSESSNPYKPNDKVFTTVKGKEVEAIVRLVWREEVQVRVASGSLLWRTVRTVRGTSAPTPDTQAAVAPQSELTVPTVELSTETESEASSSTSEAVAGANELSSSAAEEESGAAGAVESKEAGSTDEGNTESLPCGVPEAEADRKRSKKNKRRR